MYGGCPLSWCSKLKTEIDLSTTEAEYIALIQAIHEVITFMALMNEVYFIFDNHIPKPEVFGKLFKDNKSFITVAEYNKFSPKKYIYISIKFHHF